MKIEEAEKAAKEYIKRLGEYEPTKALDFDAAEYVRMGFMECWTQMQKSEQGREGGDG